MDKLVRLLSSQHLSFHASEALLAASVAFAKAHQHLCTSAPRMLESHCFPGQQSVVQQPSTPLGAATLVKSLEAVRNQVFDGFVNSLLSSLQTAIQELGQRDFVQPLAAVESIDQTIASSGGLGMAAWGECSNLPDKWYRALLAVFCPLQELSVYRPSLISAHAQRLRLGLWSSCQAFESISRCAHLLSAHMASIFKMLTICAVLQKCFAQERFVATGAAGR